MTLLYITLAGYCLAGVVCSYLVVDDILREHRQQKDQEPK